VCRISSSLGIFAAGVLLGAAVFTTLRHLEDANAQASFNAVAQERLDALETNITLTVNNLVSLGALLDASPQIDRQGFDRSTARLLAGNPAIQALEWIPRVPNRLRRKYEEDARRAGFGPFQFTQQSSQDQMIRADNRDEYFPVFWLLPFRNKIFDPFFTTTGSGKGTGQGLAIARSVVVERHRGTLTFTSEVAKGITFYIRLPLDEEATADENPNLERASSKSAGI
jgi:hypothetical protein